MKVIVGIDGSEQQADALGLGAQLARVDGGHLIIAHVYAWSRWSVRLGSAFATTVQEDAEALLRAAQATVTDVPCSVRALADLSAPRALHALAAEEHADLLVIGSSHHGAIGRAVLGSVGDRVIHAAPCAVAVAPRGYAQRADGIRRVGVAYDASPEARDALTWAGRLAEAVGASVTVFSVFEPLVLPAAYPGGLAYDYEEIEKPQREECQRNLDDAVARLPAGVEATGRMLSGGVAHALAEAAHDVDLLVAGSRGYGPVRTVVLGSVARPLVHHASCPLVVLPRVSGEAPGGAPPEDAEVGAGR